VSEAAAEPRRTERSTDSLDDPGRLTPQPNRGIEDVRPARADNKPALIVCCVATAYIPTRSGAPRCAPSLVPAQLSQGGVGSGWPVPGMQPIALSD
jgi:hypothetical protein